MPYLQRLLWEGLGRIKMQWFRFYSETISNKKAQKLRPDLFKKWVNLLCVGCHNEGVLPPLDETAFLIRCNEDETKSALHDLIEADLFTVSKNQHSEVYSPKNWRKRQYKSDTS